MLLMNSVIDEHVDSVTTDHEFAVVVGNERSLLCITPNMTEQRWVLGDEFVDWWLVTSTKNRTQCMFAKIINDQLHVAMATLADDKWTLGQPMSVGVGRLITSTVVAGDNAWVDVNGELHNEVYHDISNHGTRVAGRRWRAARVDVDGAITGLSGDEVVHITSDKHVTTRVGTIEDALRGVCAVIATEVGDVSLTNNDGTLNLQLDNTVVPALDEKLVTPRCRAVTLKTPGVIDMTTGKWTSAEQPWGKVLAVHDGDNVVQVLSIDGQQLRLTELTLGGQHVRTVDQWMLPNEANDGVIVDSKHIVALVNGLIYNCVVGQKPKSSSTAASSLIELDGEQPLCVITVNDNWMINGLAMEKKPPRRGVRVDDYIIVDSVLFVDNQASIPKKGIAMLPDAQFVKFNDKLMMSTGDDLSSMKIDTDDDALFLSIGTEYMCTGKLVAMTQTKENKVFAITWVDGLMHVTRC